MVSGEPASRMAVSVMSYVIDVATIDDAPAITALVNEAFQVEAFFKAGDRTDLQEVRRHFDTGEFLIMRSLGQATSSSPVACVYLERKDGHAYFGMLSIDPAHHGKGFGRTMIEFLESRCRAARCTEIEIHVVNLRAELPPFYRRYGYVEVGTLPYPDDGSSTRPCHFIVMKKPLT